MSLEHQPINHYLNWKESNLTRLEYCKLSGITMGQLHCSYKKSKILAFQNGFYPIEVISTKSTSSSKPLSISYPSGISIQLQTFDLSQIRSLLQLH